MLAISAGGQHSLALKMDGTVVQWGDTTHNQGSPPSGLSNVIAVSAGFYHSLALKNDGTVVQWGDTTANQGAAPQGATISSLSRQDRSIAWRLRTREP